MEHPVIKLISLAGFIPLGWFEPRDMEKTRFLMLIGNAGPQMFQRFSDQKTFASMDDWTRRVVDELAADLGAAAVYPFDEPYQPFQRWAQACGIAHQSPLGLYIHPVFGLWHAYRAALLFTVQLGLPTLTQTENPCLACKLKPCLSACPVSAFRNEGYDISTCASHLHEQNTCMTGGCKARIACPVGRTYIYEPAQMEFHMNAFKAAHPR